MHVEHKIGVLCIHNGDKRTLHNHF